MFLSRLLLFENRLNLFKFMLMRKSDNSYEMFYSIAGEGETEKETREER